MTEECDRHLLEVDGKAMLLIYLGELHVWRLRKLLHIRPQIAFYYYAFIFEASDLHGESGVHKHITELQFLNEEARPITGITVTPTIARLDFNGEAYDRLRRGGRVRGSTPFPSYTKVGA